MRGRAPAGPLLARAVGVATVVLLTAGTAACGGSGASSSGPTKEASASATAGDGDHGEEAADTSTCVADARAYAGTPPAGFARSFPLPRGAVLVGVQDRGADGVVATAVVKAGLRTVLAHLNGPAQAQGFKVTEGETEEHDAEANWSGNGYRGRWAIRDSTACPGEVDLLLLSKKQ
ncbi:MAG: hypothetical protein JWR20_2164 [Marmoricola sp.]|nr:hypothetical protein [Marmoricola sp.]